MVGDGHLILISVKTEICEEGDAVNIDLAKRPNGLREARRGAIAGG
jgi:hypothetical protein